MRKSKKNIAIKRKGIIGSIVEKILELQLNREIPEFIINEKASILYQSQLGRNFRNGVIDEQGVAREFDLLRYSFVCEMDDIYNYAEEGESTVISANYKRYMISACRRKDLNLVSLMLTINTRYAESELYYNHVQAPIFIGLLGPGCLGGSFEITALLLESGASLFKKYRMNTPIDFLLYFASGNMKGYEDQHAALASANSILNALYINGYIDHKAVNENGKSYIKLVELQLKRYEMSNECDKENVRGAENFK